MNNYFDYVAKLSFFLLFLGLSACGVENSDNKSNDNSDPQGTVPYSQADTASTVVGQGVSIDILANDSGLDDGDVSVVILSSPNRGSAVLNADNTIMYVPSGLYAGEDSFTYQVTNVGGGSSISNVSITIECTALCSSIARSIRVSWEPNVEVDIEGYYVYFGTESGNYSEHIWVGNNTTHDYMTNTFGTLYFAVTALNAQGAESDFSQEIVIN